MKPETDPVAYILLFWWNQVVGNAENTSQCNIGHRPLHCYRTLIVSLLGSCSWGANASKTYQLVATTLFLTHASSTYSVQAWGLLFHLVTHMDTHMRGRIFLDEGSTNHRDLYLYNTQPSQDTCGIRTCNPCRPPTTDKSLRLYGHRDRHTAYLICEIKDVVLLQRSRLMFPMFLC